MLLLLKLLLIVHLHCSTSQRYAAGVVRLGCNEGWRKGCANYFILLGRDDSADSINAATSAIINGTQQRVPSSSQLHQSNSSNSANGSSSGSSGSSGVTPYWLLKPISLAGGKVSLAHAIGSLVEAARERRQVGAYTHFNLSLTALCCHQTTSVWLQSYYSCIDHQMLSYVIMSAACVQWFICTVLRALC
jgi:hypothetical protein